MELKEEDLTRWFNAFRVLNSLKLKFVSKEDPEKKVIKCCRKAPDIFKPNFAHSNLKIKLHV